MIFATRHVGALLFFFIFMCFGVGTAGAETLQVPSSFDSIQGAIDSALDGDTIEVVHGKYTGDLHIAGSRSVRLHSNPGAIIRGTLIVEGATIDIDGFVIRPRRSSLSPDAVVLRGADHSKISNCLIRGFSDSGILVEESNNVEIHNNAICGGDRAIESKFSEDLSIKFNSISGNSDYGVLNVNEENLECLIDASQNWWGDASGPSGEGPGVGDAVSKNVIYDDWDAPTDEPTITILHCYVTGFSYNHTIYKGDIAEYVIEYMIEGGSDYAKYIVMAQTVSEFGFVCDPAKEKARGKSFVGKGVHTMLLKKKIPGCADDWTYGSSFTGVAFEMEGAWVDVKYKVRLRLPGLGEVAKDTRTDEAAFLVKKRP
jgi:hypothetical protein